MGSLDIDVSSYAEQNHSSLRAIAGDDPKRSIENNITDVMQRTGLLFEQRQVMKDMWASRVSSDLESIVNSTERSHLSRPRKELDRRPFGFFRDSI